MCYFHVNLLKTTYIKKLQLFVTINSLQRSNFASDASTWPSGLRRQFQALVFSNAWVRTPQLTVLFALADTVLSLLLILLLLLVSVFFFFAWLLFFWPVFFLLPGFVLFRCLPFCFPFLLIVVSFFCSSFSSPYETKNK